jgi:hypothetical protein
VRTSGTAVLGWIAASFAAAWAMSRFDAGFSASLAAVAGVYLFGYMVGALLVSPAAGASWSLCCVRLLSGLLLTTVSFFFSLTLSLPWLCGPAALLVAALVVQGRAAFGPLPTAFWGWSDAVAVAVGVLLFAPTLISAFRMAPGPFPPLFFNVDTPYFLEKVHALVRSDTYPPPSLSVLDGRLAYHFGIQGLAAFISRISGLAAHHALFLVVVPVLVAGVLGAALFCARAIAAKIPTVVSASPCDHRRPTTSCGTLCSTTVTTSRLTSWS